MAESLGGNGRVSIEADFHELYKRLTEGNNIESSPFQTMKDVFMLAACLGYERGRPKPLVGKKQQIFHWAQFSERTDHPVLKAMAIAKTGGIEVLANPEKIVEIAEEYANAGIQELRMSLDDQAGQPLWNLVDILRQ